MYDVMLEDSRGVTIGLWFTIVKKLDIPNQSSFGEHRQLVSDILLNKYGAILFRSSDEINTPFLRFESEAAYTMFLLAMS